MRTLNIILFLIVISISTWGQLSPQKIISIEDEEFNTYFLHKENIPTIRGRFLNVTKNDIDKALIEYSIVSPIASKNITKTCKLDSIGNFILELEYAIPFQQITIRAGRLYYANLYVNNDLFIELDAQILKQKIIIV